MTNRIRFAALLLAVVAALFSAPAHAASPDRPCVDKSEYLSLHNGMSRHDVQAVLGDPGRTYAPVDTGGKGYLVRHYGVCGVPTRDALVVVVYYRATDRVTGAMFMYFRARYAHLFG